MNDRGAAGGQVARPALQMFRQGILEAPSVAGLVLFCSFVGFGALAHESGVSVVFALLTSAFVWALPGQVVLVSEVAAGASLLVAALAVTLTAIRLMPLTVTLLPLLRDRGTSRVTQYLLAHFIAITVWTESHRRLPPMMRRERIPYYLGFAGSFFTANMAATVIGYYLAGALGSVVSAALLFLTPLYFAVSMILASSELADRLALAAGFVLGPVFFVYSPGFELMLSGLIGGTGAYLVGRWARARPPS